MSSCILFLTVIIVGAYATDYCTMKTYLEERMTHTMCKYTSLKPALRCGKWRKQGLSCDEKQAILDAHNAERQKVAAGKETRGNPGPQPSAFNMSNLIWDNELEKIAQRWANQCIYDHDEYRDVERFPVGQNIAWIDFSGENYFKVEQLVQIWIDEVDLFNRDDVSRLPDNYFSIGHYTQVVYGNTKSVGCGQIVHQISNPGYERQYLVCNYGPAGNYKGEPIYQIKE